MTNTEKPSTKEEIKKQGVVNTPKIKESSNKTPITKPATKEISSVDKSGEPKVDEQVKKSEEKAKEQPKKEVKKVEKPKVKKTIAFVDVLNLPISTKQSIAICKFVKGKSIEKAITDLEQVSMIKKVVPMKGEIPHKKGKGISSGRYPKKSAEQFIKLLKSLSANANVNDLNNPIITEAIANLASRPYGKFGRVRRKRTHVKITAKEKKSKNKEKKKEKI
ncbi:MAG TPA: hypothetical protein ENG87_04330 [Candidatus Pacearchaeota archaeon]|nr:50S ribosomal protein L22P [archaeon BMS3Abin17]HDK42582.1 hypothetical protein [Candidatus Pacearchaeota archaeon]HDZ60421.1 hypothetical protein [Candidatus Pacearchaeota archaeon]